MPTVVRRFAFAATAGHLFTLNKDEFKCYWKFLVCMGFLSPLVVFASLRQVTEGLWRLTKNDLWNRIPDIGVGRVTLDHFTEEEIEAGRNEKASPRPYR